MNKLYWLKDMSKLELLLNNLLFSQSLIFWAVIIDFYARNL